MSERIKPLPCIVCKTQLEPAFGDWWTQPVHGMTFRDEAAYGSGFDGTGVIVTICDQCLKDNRDVVLEYTRTQFPPVFEYTKFASWMTSD